VFTSITFFYDKIGLGFSEPLLESRKSPKLLEEKEQLL
jgi:hypothetical protein